MHIAPYISLNYTSVATPRLKTPAPTHSSLLPLFAASSCDAACFFTFQVQLVSGASPLAYWVSTYLWDVLLFFVLSCLVMLTFAAYGRDASKVKPNQFDRAKHDRRTEWLHVRCRAGKVSRVCVPSLLLSASPPRERKCARGSKNWPCHHPPFVSLRVPTSTYMFQCCCLLYPPNFCGVTLTTFLYFL